jgi:hypothetical protein
LKFRFEFELSNVFMKLSLGWKQPENIFETTTTSGISMLSRFEVLSLFLFTNKVKICCQVKG